MKDSTIRSTISRRKFIGNAGLGLATIALAPKNVLANDLRFANKIRIGICLGSVGAQCSHPGVLRSFPYSTYNS